MDPNDNDDWENNDFSQDDWDDGFGNITESSEQVANVNTTQEEKQDFSKEFENDLTDFQNVVNQDNKLENQLLEEHNLVENLIEEHNLVENNLEEHAFEEYKLEKQTIEFENNEIQSIEISESQWNEDFNDNDWNSNENKLEANFDKVENETTENLDNKSSNEINSQEVDSNDRQESDQFENNIQANEVDNSDSSQILETDINLNNQINQEIIEKQNIVPSNQDFETEVVSTNEVIQDNSLEKSEENIEEFNEYIEDKEIIANNNQDLNTNEIQLDSAIENQLNSHSNKDLLIDQENNLEIVDEISSESSNNLILQENSQLDIKEENDALEQNQELENGDLEQNDFEPNINHGNFQIQSLGQEGDDEKLIEKFETNSIPDSKEIKETVNINDEFDEFETEEWNNEKSNTTPVDVNRKFDDFGTDDDFDDDNFQSADEASQFSDFGDEDFQDNVENEPITHIELNYVEMVNTILNSSIPSEQISKMFSNNIHKIIPEAIQSDIVINNSGSLNNLLKPLEFSRKQDKITWHNSLLEEAILKQSGFIKKQKLVHRKRLHPTSTHTRTFSGLSNVNTASVLSPISDSIPTTMVSTHRQQNSKSKSKSTQDELSDSELEEFNNILEQSKNARTLTDSKEGDSQDNSTSQNAFDDDFDDFGDEPQAISRDRSLSVTRKETIVIDEPSEMNFEGLVLRERSQSISGIPQVVVENPSPNNEEQLEIENQEKQIVEDFGDDFDNDSFGDAEFDNSEFDPSQTDSSFITVDKDKQVKENKLEIKKDNDFEDDFDDDFSETSFDEDVNFEEDTKDIDNIKVSANFEQEANIDNSNYHFDNTTNDWDFDNSDSFKHTLDTNSNEIDLTSNQISSNISESTDSIINIRQQSHDHLNNLKNNTIDILSSLKDTNSNEIQFTESNSEFITKFDDFLNLTVSDSNKQSSEVSDILNSIPNLDFIQSNQFIKDVNKSSGISTDILDFF